MVQGVRTAVEFVETGPDLRVHTASYVRYEFIFLSAVLYLVIDPHRVALYPITRLVARPIIAMNGIDPNLGLSQKSCYGTRSLGDGESRSH